MPRQLKKHKEQSEAYQASWKLGEEWQLEDRESPDFLVTSAGRCFGLEVTSCHIGPKTRKGSAERAKESSNHQGLTEIRARYEAAGGVGLNLRYRGQVSANAADELLLALLNTGFETRTLFDPPERLDLSDAMVYVHATPNVSWLILNDRAGWVSQDGSFLQREIDLKAKKLPTYRQAFDDIRLLVVADRIYNSGKLQLQDGFRPLLRGFDAVYFFSYPSSVSAFYASDDDQSVPV